MKIRLAAVQPRSASGDREAENLDQAIEWIERAAAASADLVVFPEGYPGPTNPRNEYDALVPIREAAARHRIHVVAGRVEGAEPPFYRVALHLIDDTGTTIGTYHRTSPPGPYIYQDIDAWAFDYREADQVPRIFDTRLGRIGLLVCSELYVPELSRLLALDGADLILYPAGGAINELLPGWRTLVRARAIENLVYTAATQNLYGDEEGVGTIAGPEAVLAESAGAGLLLADLDLDRLAYLRGRDERIEYPKPYSAIPGVLRWRRPELYGRLVEPRESTS